MTDVLRLPEVAEPLVSVIMVTFGGGQTARHAVEELIENTDPCYELLVVDNASPDDTASQLKAGLDGATLVENRENEGFARACNEGAEIARGRYLCFLNPDAFVQPGWLRPLLEVLEEDPAVAAAVPLFLHPDGRVQEAGSALDADGAAIAIGDGGDPEAFEHRFRRTVDYGSAACLLVRADRFAEVGGFDPRYSPAYYEDADLCFKLRARGLKTVFEPRSRVVHVRGGGSRQAELLMIANRRVFADRWQARLDLRRPLQADPSNPRLRVAARDADALDRILVIDDRVPHYDRGSGDPRMAKILAELVDLYPEARITFFGADPINAERYAPPLLELGIEVEAAEKDFDRWFQQRRYHYSTVLLSRADNVERFDRKLRLTQPQARRIYDIEALSFRRLAQRGHEAADRFRELELIGLAGADVVFCVSDEEASFARELTNARVLILPMYVEPPDSSPGFEERDGLVFFGGFMAGSGGPNEDAAVRLTNEVMPKLWATMPDLPLAIVGANPTPAVRELQGPLVDVVGFVPDPLERLARARVHVHPIRLGAGIKLKLIDTMAAGLPFVTSPVGAEGLGLGELEDVLVAEDDEQLARFALALYSDRDLWERVQAELLGIVRQRFARESFRATLVDAFTHLGVAPPVKPLVPAP
jgi:GT2 family glycosyltransferase